MSLQTKIEFSFTSLDDFIKFVELIRGKEIDPKEVKKLTKDLVAGSFDLDKAINSQKEK